MRKTMAVAALLCTVFLAGFSSADVIDIDANSADAGVDSGGTIQWTGQTVSRIGNNAVGTLTTHVMPFLLPDLQGESVSSVSLAAYCNGANANVRDTPDVYIDLLGVRVSSSSKVLATDYTGTVMVDGAYRLNTSLAAGTLTFTSVSLTSYIQSIYDNDAGAAGKYLFLAIAPDASSTGGYAYTELSTADNATVENRPVLTITTAVPEPATVGMLGFGALVAMLIRRIQI